MEYCEQGDLNDFYQKRQMKQSELLELMIQMSQGVVYLHENLIIHTDIKPANILIAREAPILVKLADFDVSKFLDENYETSEMQTNVGTPAFKAPEFFRRNTRGQISYHRNVDVFSLGLTFLAILQATPESRKLAPCIETILDNSDRFTSIGQVIATRVRFHLKELNVVILDANGSGKSHKSPFDPVITLKLKELIQKMTSVEPKHRFSAAEVLRDLQGMSEINVDHQTLVSSTDERLGSSVSDATVAASMFGRLTLQTENQIKQETSISSVGSELAPKSSKLYQERLSSNLTSKSEASQLPPSIDVTNPASKHEVNRNLTQENKARFLLHMILCMDKLLLSRYICFLPHNSGRTI